MKKIICNLCGSDRHRVIYALRADSDNGVKKYYLITEGELTPPTRIFRCVDCGLVFAPLAGDNESLLSNYEEMIDKKYVEEEESRRITARFILEKLNKFKRNSGRLLDVGCCTGFLLDEARIMGWEVCGIEPSKWAVEHAGKKFNLDIHNTTLEKTNFPGEYFDAVIMQDTIEHLLNPRKALMEVKRILKPGGILYINTPNIECLAGKILRGKWWGINQFHLYYFSKRTLKEMLKSVGFKDFIWSSYTRIFTLRYWIERFKKYNKFIYNILICVSMMGISKDRLIRVNLRDQIEVFAKK